MNTNETVDAAAKIAAGMAAVAYQNDRLGGAEIMEIARHALAIVKAIEAEARRAP
jgi:hypothetical protein